jgi:hypothetical protein
LREKEREALLAVYKMAHVNTLFIFFPKRELSLSGKKIRENKKETSHRMFRANKKKYT